MKNHKQSNRQFLWLSFASVILFVLLSHSAHAATYTVSTETSTVDGETFCDGSACTASDTIIIAGGARGNLLFENFNGNGSYIAIKNESGTSKVVLTLDSSVGWGVLSFRNCKYIDVKGNNDSNIPYGIKLIHDGSDIDFATGIFVYGQSDHIKLSNIECAFDGNTTETGIGIIVQDTPLTSDWVFDTFEIHHNYIHGSRYSAMYLGGNTEGVGPHAYVNNFSIHDNLIEDSGTYGITYKGVNSGTSNIFNNTVKRTGLVGTLDGGFQQGIGIAYLYSSGTTVNVYDNWIEKTKGNGIKVGNSGNTYPTLNIYQNTIVGCGTGNETDYGHGVGLATYVLCDVNVYDNIIVKPTRYGLFAGGSTIGNCDRNLIGGGLGERVETGDGVWNEGIGADANIYHANVADFGFTTWSDDDDYSNDDFTILGNDTTSPSAPQGLSVE